MSRPVIHVCENLEVVFSGRTGEDCLETITNLALYDISKAHAILSEAGIETVSERNFRDYNGGQFSHQAEMYGYKCVGTTLMAHQDTPFTKAQWSAICEASEEIDRALQAVADYLTTDEPSETEDA